MKAVWYICFLLFLSPSPAGPVNPERALRNGITAFEVGWWKTALAILRPVAESPTVPREQRLTALRYLGAAYAQKGDDALAVETFKTLLRLSPAPVLDAHVFPRAAVERYLEAYEALPILTDVHLRPARFHPVTEDTALVFALTRPARVKWQIRAPDGTVQFETSAAAERGLNRLTWEGFFGEQFPPEGRYEYFLRAETEEGEWYEVTLPVKIELYAPLGLEPKPHLDRLPDKKPLPTEKTIVHQRPNPSLRAAGLSILGVGLFIGVLTEDEDIRSAAEVLMYAGAGLALYANFGGKRERETVELPENVAYNEQLQTELAERNRRIDEENERRRRRVRVQQYWD
ncbi:MAG TPA: hypothetical protein EYP85_02345 [Armatimonadetes bacterium]|nr:hypothetical protein [Armatimonadota bacterium]